MRRDAADRHFGANHYDRSIWHVINTHMRPFTARRHPLSTARVLEVLNATDEFRAELTRLQTVPVQFDALLLEVRGDRRPPPELEPHLAGGSSPKWIHLCPGDLHALDGGEAGIAVSMDKPSVTPSRHAGKPTACTPAVRMLQVRRCPGVHSVGHVLVGRARVAGQAELIARVRLSVDGVRRPIP